jgi:hypothetical protein
MALAAATAVAPTVLEPAGEIPLELMVTGVSPMATLLTTVEPETVPVLPSDEAVAVEVTAPMEMRPPRMEMPESVAVAVAVAAAPVAPEVEVPELKPMPKMDEVDDEAPRALADGALSS